MFKSLNHFQKFQPGSDFWLIFFEPEKNIFKEINWRTGFLLQNLNEKEGCSQPILIDTRKIFPNRSLASLPLKKEQWLADAYNIWRQLSKPSFRVFTPCSDGGEQLKRYWPQLDSLHNLSYYNESHSPA